MARFGDVWESALRAARDVVLLDPLLLEVDQEQYIAAEVQEACMDQVYHLPSVQALYAAILRTDRNAVLQEAANLLEHDTLRRSTRLSTNRPAVEVATNTRNTSTPTLTTTAPIVHTACPPVPEANALACRPVVTAPLCTECGVNRTCDRCREASTTTPQRGAATHELTSSQMTRAIIAQESTVPRSTARRRVQESPAAESRAQGVGSFEPIPGREHFSLPIGPLPRASAKVPNNAAASPGGAARQPAARRSTTVRGVDESPTPATERTLRNCRWCPHECDVTNKNRVAGELAAHITSHHVKGHIVLDPALLTELNLKQCPNCLVVCPNRSAGRHQCQQRLESQNEQEHGSSQQCLGGEVLRPNSIHIPDNTSPIYLRRRCNPVDAVPKKAEAIWEAAVRRALHKFTTKPCAETCIEFLELPARLLQVAPGTTRSRVTQIHIACTSYLGVPSQRQQRNSAPQLHRQRSSDEILAAKVTKTLRQGAGSRAWRLLQSSGVHSLAEETRNAIRAKFPAGTHVMSRSQGLVLSATEVQNAIRTMPPGAAPGVTGWTKELLRPAQDREDIASALGTLLASLDGSINVALPNLVIPLKKPDDGIRPVCLVDVIFKIVGKCAVLRCRERLTKLCEGIQFGLLGAERPITIIRTAIENGSSAVLVDCINAFNSILQECIDTAISSDEQLGPLHYAAEIELGRPSKLFCFGEDLRHNLSRGIRQGSAASPAMFCMATLALLRKVQEKHQDVKVVAYLDDIVLLGSDASLLAATRTLIDELRLVGLEVRPSDSIAFRAPQTATALGFTPKEDSFSVLGACFGTEDAAREFCNEVARTQAATLDKTEKLKLHPAMHLLAQEAPSKMVYVLRNHRPEHTLEAAEVFDEVTDTIRQDRLPQLTPFELQVAELRRCKGGMGWRSARTVQKVAFAAAQTEKKGAQQEATHKLEEQWISDNISEFTCPSTSTLEEAGSSAFPDITRNSMMQDEVYVTWLRHRLGHIPHGMVDRVRHKGGRHDKIRNVVAAILHENGHARTIEPAGLLSGQQRPDILVYPAQGTRPVAVDVTVCLARNRVKATIAHHEKLKRESYEQVAAERGFRFLPLVVTTRGAFGEGFVDFIREFFADPPEAMDRIALALAEGNAALAH